MDLRLTFNEDAENYDKLRPSYCRELFEDIFKYSENNQSKRALEIGIGTGQATAPFLKNGYDVTAIELGKELAEFSRSKFRQYKNFRVLNLPFEEYQCEDNTYDILYSATAFHWIPDDVGYPKARRLLQENGTLAVFWNRPFSAREDDLLHQRIQKIYQKYRPSSHKPVENDTERYRNISETIKSYGFRNFELKLYHKTRAFSSSDYIKLLNTYSDHRIMEPSIKSLFEEEIRSAILENDDTLNIYDTMDLYLARK